jgi:hypothetical protein
MPLNNDSINIQYRSVDLSPFAAAIRVALLGTHNRGEYGTQLLDFDAEFRSPLESYDAILNAFYKTISVGDVI